MTHKATADYEAVFQTIKDSFPEEWGPPLLEEVIYDLKKAVWNSIKVFPGVKVRGCFFHWTPRWRSGLRKKA